MKRDTPRPAAELVEHWTWTRRLAGHLVTDPALADDLAQDAWLRASRHPGVEPSRGFLGAVVRNLVRERARGDRHRADRERGSAARRTSPAPDEILAAAETGQALAAAVLELAEPVRDVLLMRYFEGLPAIRIAEALDLPEGTVRSRIKRGLDALRARFEGSNGRSRLMALVGVPGATAAKAAGKSAWAALRVASVAAVAATTIYAVIAVFSHADNADAQVAVIPRTALVDETTGEEDLAQLSTATERGAALASTLAVGEAESSTVIVTGTLVDEWHRPLEGASVVLRGRAVGKTEHRVTTAADGSFRLESEFTPDVQAKLLIDAGVHRADRKMMFDTSGVGIARALEAGVRDLGEIIVPPRGSVRARIVNAVGDPLSGFTAIAQTVSGLTLGSAKTSADGVASITKLPAGSVCILAIDPWDRLAAETEIQVVPGLVVKTESLVSTLPDYRDETISDHTESETAEEPIVEDQELAKISGRLLRDGVGAAGVPVIIRRLHGRDAGWNTLAFTSESAENDLQAAETLWHGRPEDQVRTDAEGRFALECDTAGVAYELIASAEHDHVRTRLSMGGGDDVNLGSLTLMPNAHVTLRVQAPEGLAGWEFECRPTTLHPNVGYASDGDGLLRLPPLPAGLHTLALLPIRDRLDSGVSVRIDLQAGESRTIDVDARTFGMCRVTLRPGSTDDPLPTGDVIFAPDGVKMPYRVTVTQRNIAAFEAVEWSRSEQPERTAFVRAIGLADVGFVDRAGRSVRFGGRPVDLRSCGHVDVTLDLGRTAALEIAFPREIIPGEEGMISVECAGGTTLLPVRDGRLAPLAWGVDCPSPGRLRIRGLAAGSVHVRVRITDTAAGSRRTVTAKDGSTVLMTSTLEAAVTLAVGRVVALDLANIPAVADGAPAH